MNKKLEPLDSLSEDEIVEKKIMNKTKKKNTKNEIKIKSLKDMFNEYEELLNKIRTATVKLDSETIDKCAVLINKYAADCSSEI